MLEVFDDMFCLMRGERCVVGVSRELSFTSDDSSIVLVGG